MNRREFIKVLGTATLCLATPTALAKEIISGKHSKRILIMLELKGGNDGLNTLIPYTQKHYYEYRPKIAIPANTLLKLDATVGMHPALQPLKALWQMGNMAWVQGVGYPHQDRSHFRSIEIWDSGIPDSHHDDQGWLTRNLNAEGIPGIAINSSLGPLMGIENASISIRTPEQFARQGRKIKALAANTNNSALQHILGVQTSIDAFSEKMLVHLNNAPTPKLTFPDDRFGKDLRSLYALITGGTPVPAYKISLGGFDTHTNQLETHKTRLATLANGLSILSENLRAAGYWDNVLIMSYSEFGRRARENASKGTDHGAAAPHFVLGGQVKGGLYGTYPSLEDLDERGDLKFTTDYRDIYSTILKSWWNISSAPEKKLNFI